MGKQPDVMDWHGFEVIDRDGDKVGKLDEIYLDGETGGPDWAIVNTGLFGRRSSFVPLREAIRDGDMIRVPYPRDQIKDAPSIDPDDEVSPDEEHEIYEHYGLEYSPAGSSTDAGPASGRAAEAGSRETAEPGCGEPRLERYVREEIRNRTTRGDGPTTVRDERATTRSQDS
jgi:sporulation protein YlmC with PRC-barrel domain